MDIKPLYDTNTIKFVNPAVTSATKLSQKVAVDPDNVIPNGIYKVIRWENIRQKVTLSLFSILSIASIIFIVLYMTVLNSSILSIIIPSCILVLSFYKIFITISEINYLTKSLIRYKEDLKIGLSDAPPFIAKLYKSIIKKQANHNWITFVIVFYGGITTLLLWWLKDVSFWIFNFKEWIRMWFSNPDLMTIIFSIALLSVMLIQIVLTIQRKKKLLEIDLYFGNKIMPESDSIAIKQDINKCNRRLFVISIMIFMIIPVIAWFTFKFIKRKR
ncbi:MSC_0882 family membrane protein [Candidatus Mycoplasma mahonii]|uniref:MSC_0882 family membrane protein n=1 Tax=Candidatus Mycoplasma mahonii TaxID=3004105 RepID=UPI0026EA0D1F|nr:hypothetical protein [Candidatus Mycoplasma mahonii]WKX02161.1 hypothetical protein O3I44_02035 [Candidatus Mycoplasma mahonii]